MKRIGLLVAIVVGAAAGWLAWAQQEGMPERAATVTVSESDEYGAYLTDAEGLTLYLFEDEEAEEEAEGEAEEEEEVHTLPCTGECAQAWPPFLTEGPASAGDGADASLLGLMERDDGSIQVTYAGWPLYYYHEDEMPGDTNGQGIEPPDEHAFGGAWYLVSPEGEAIEGDE